MEELKSILEKFVVSGWDLISPSISGCYTGKSELI